MSRPVAAMAFAFAVMLGSSAAALADAGGNCGSAASAPGLPGASNENEPRSCDTGPIQQPEPSATPPAQDAEPSGASEIPQPPAPEPEPIPEPPPPQ